MESTLENFNFFENLSLKYHQSSAVYAIYFLFSDFKFPHIGSTPGLATALSNKFEVFQFS